MSYKHLAYRIAGITNFDKIFMADADQVLAYICMGSVSCIYVSMTTIGLLRYPNLEQMFHRVIESFQACMPAYLAGKVWSTRVAFDSGMTQHHKQKLD